MANKVAADPFTGFPPAVFDVFFVPGFDERMQRLRAEATPRLRALGEALADPVSALVGEPLYPHVALHMRRRVNPPDDTWVAWGRSARGYKAVIHFEVGVSAAGVFTRLVVKPEGQAEKPLLLDRLTPSRLVGVPGSTDLWWYKDDHGQGGVPANQVEPDWHDLKARALKPANSVTVGFELPREDPRVGSPLLRDYLLDRLAALAPLYRLAREGP